MKQKLNEETIQEETDADSPSVEVDSSADIDGAEGLMDSIESTAESFDVAGFECSECGVYHNHSDVKHQAGDSMSGIDSTNAATTFDMDSSCHCGYNEAAMKDMDGAPSPSEAFRTAPIPDSKHREMKAEFQ